MKHLFVPYELALKLKEKGFDEPCIAHHVFEQPENNYVFQMGAYFYREIKPNYTPAPLYQQVVDWLYEKGVSLELYSCDMGKNFNHVLRKVGRNLYEIKALDNKAVPDRYQAFNKGIEEALKLLNQTK